jgi:hypothetical protein
MCMCGSPFADCVCTRCACVLRSHGAANPERRKGRPGVQTQCPCHRDCILQSQGSCVTMWGSGWVGQSVISNARACVCAVVVVVVFVVVVVGS